MEETLFFTYIVECSDKTFYIGKTTDLEKRLRQHNGEIKGGAKYTRIRRPVVLKYYETYPTITLALKREYHMKRLTHAKKKQLINTS